MDVVLILVGYTVGTIPFALLLARRIRGTDVRYVGSGNVGAANVLRTTGMSVALIVMTLDISKGCAAVLFADRMGADDAMRATVGAAAVIGPCIPGVVEVPRREGRGDRVRRVRGLGAESDGGGSRGVRGRGLDHALRVGGVDPGVASTAVAGVSDERFATGGYGVDRGGDTGAVPASCQRVTLAVGERVEIWSPGVAKRRRLCRWTR